MRYGKRIYEPKASEMTCGISHITSVISDLSIVIMHHEVSNCEILGFISQFMS